MTALEKRVDRLETKTRSKGRFIVFEAADGTTHKEVLDYLGIETTDEDIVVMQRRFFCDRPPKLTSIDGVRVDDDNRGAEH